MQSRWMKRLQMHFNLCNQRSLQTSSQILIKCFPSNRGRSFKSLKTTPNKRSVLLKDADVFRERGRRKGKASDGWRAGRVLWGKTLRACLYCEYSDLLSPPGWLSFVFPVSGLSLRASFLPVCTDLFFPACSFPSACHSARYQPPKVSIFCPQFKREKVHFQPLISSSLWHEYMYLF